MIKITNLHEMTKDDIKKKISQSKDKREHERWLCVYMSIKGLSVPDIADYLNREEKTIREWITAFNMDGSFGIKRKSPPGKKKRLTDKQIAQLILDFEKSPTEFSFGKGYWTTRIIKKHIHRNTKIKYGRSQICNLMREWGFSIKRPRMKSLKPDEKEQTKFIKIDFPGKIKEMQEEANRRGLKLKILFTDEAGIRRDGTIHYGWYKKGKIAEIPESNGRFESIKLIGAVDALEGNFHLMKAPSKVTTKVYVDFLKMLSTHYKGYLLLIVHDNAPWHGKLKLPKLLKEEGVNNIEIQNLPKYSPDMNPCERFWNWMRETVSHCRYYEDLKELSQSIWRFYRRAYKQKEEAKRRFKTEKDIFAFVKASGKEKEADGKIIAVA